MGSAARGGGDGRVPWLGGAWAAGDRAGRRWYGSGLPGAPLERLTQRRALAGPGRLPAARHDHAAAESGSLVHFPHRSGPGGARHLRLRAPQSADDAALLLYEPDRGAALQDPAWGLRATAFLGARGDVAQGRAVLADAVGPAHPGDHHAHANELSAG